MCRALNVSFAGSPQEQPGAVRRNCVSGGAAAVAVQIPVSRIERRVGRRPCSTRDTGIWTQGEPLVRRGTRLSREAPELRPWRTGEYLNGDGWRPIDVSAILSGLFRVRLPRPM